MGVVTSGVLVAGALAAGVATSNNNIGSGKSAEELAAEAKQKTDKDQALRRAGMARNETLLSEDEEPDKVAIPTAAKSIFNKKTMG